MSLEEEMSNPSDEEIISILHQRLQTAKKENENLTKKVRNQSLKITDLYHILSENEHYIKVECPKEFEEIVQENRTLTQQNKQMMEALEFIKTKYEPYIAYLQVVEDINKIMTALKGVE